MNMFTTFILGIVVGWILHSLMDYLGARRFDDEYMDPEDAEFSAQLFGCVKWVVPVGFVMLLGFALVWRGLFVGSDGLGFKNPFADNPSTEMIDPNNTNQAGAITTDGNGVMNGAEPTIVNNNPPALATQPMTAVETEAIVAGEPTADLVPTQESNVVSNTPIVAENTLAPEGTVGGEVVSAETQPVVPTEPYIEPTAENTQNVAADTPPQKTGEFPARPVIDTNGVETFTGTDLTIVGVSQPDSVVLVMLNGILYGTAKSDVNGSWIVMGKVAPANYTIVAYLMSPTGLIDSEPVVLNVLP